MNLHDMTPDDAIAEAARRAERRARGLQLHDEGTDVDRARGTRAARPGNDPAPVGHVWHYRGPQVAPSSGLLESKEQWRIIQLLRLAGAEEPRGKVYNLSQPRASKQTAGIGDVYAVFRDPALAWRGSVWIETKVEGGTISAEQWQFALDSHAIGQPHVFGDVRAVVDFLCARGLARYDLAEPHGIAFPARTP